MTNVVSSETPLPEDKKKIRPIYWKLQGYYAAVPNDVNIYNERIWMSFNETVDELTKLTQKDYSSFKVTPQKDQFRPQKTLANRDEYRTQLAGLMYSLYGEYFYDDPMKSNPSTIINNQQSQQQTMTVTLLDLQSKIDQELSKTTDEKEKSFLQMLKDQLGTVISVGQLIQLILSLIQQTGLDPHKASSLLA